MDAVGVFDHLIIFRDSVFKASNNLESDCDSLLDCVVETLSEAMKDRVSSISKISLQVATEALHGIPAIGIKLRNGDANVAFIKGPLSESDAGKAFRAFWGEKAQLRRIDGDLYETVLWSANDNVIKQIVDYILRSRFNLFRGSFKNPTWNQVTSDSLNGLLTPQWTSRSLNPSTASSLRLVRSVDKLRSILHGLNDKLPLNFTGILPVSSAFRDTATFSPILTVPSVSRIPLGKLQKMEEKYFEKLRASIFHPVFPLYVIVTLEQSGRWPDNIEAFLHMKRLLLIRIHELLSPIGVPSRVTKSNMLDVFLDGLVFRVSIAQPQELRLLQLREVGFSRNVEERNLTQVNRNGQKHGCPLQTHISTHITNSTSWMRLNQSLPTIAGLISSVSRAMPHVFPTACRLAKRWLSSHGFPVLLCPFEAEFDNSSVTTTGAGLQGFVATEAEQELNPIYSCGRMTEIALELLIISSIRIRDSAAVYTDQSTEKLPVAGAAYDTEVTNSPVTAFLRFLALLSTHDWESRPLLVDLNDGFTDLAKRRVAVASLKGDRTRMPAMVICTPVDPEGTEWTTAGPSRIGLQELRRLASQSYKLLRAMLVGGAQIKDIKRVFQPSFKNLDVLLTLKGELLNVRASEALYFTRTRYSSKSDLSKVDNSEQLTMEIPPPGARFWPVGYCFDPVDQFIKSLRLHLGRFCEIRWDRHGGDWIGLKWHAHLMVLSKNTPFSQELLDGLVSHKQIISKSIARMSAVHQLNTVADLLPRWATHYIESVRLPQTFREQKRNRNPASTCLTNPCR